MEKFSSIIIPTLLLHLSTSMDLPPFIKPCKIKDPDFQTCSAKEANSALKVLLPGVKEIGVPSLIPYQIPEVEYKNDKAKIKLSGGTLSGFDTIVINAIIPNLDEGKFFMPFTVKNFELKSTYDIDGIILNNQIKNAGSIEITMHNVEVKYYLFIRIILKKDGLKYMKVQRDAMELVPEKIQYAFTGVFGDDSEKNAKFNELINRETEKANEEILPVVANTIRNLIRGSVYETIAEQVPFDQLFL